MLFSGRVKAALVFGPEIEIAVAAIVDSAAAELKKMVRSTSGEVQGSDEGDSMKASKVSMSVISPKTKVEHRNAPSNCVSSWQKRLPKLTHPSDNLKVMRASKTTKTMWVSFVADVAVGDADEESNCSKTTEPK